MATTTTYYGFDIPQSSDLVKDGATAIATLGQDIDTAMNTALGTKKSGLVLLNTTSFSGVASQSLSANLFSSSYDHYRIILNNLSASSGSPTVRMRLRASGTDATGTDYGTAGLIAEVYTGNATKYVSQRDQTSFELNMINTSTDQNRTMSFDLYSPFLAKSTSLSGFGNFIDDASYLEVRYFGGQHELETSYDSITFLASSGNITGTVSVYGYNK